MFAALIFKTCNGRHSLVSGEIVHAASREAIIASWCRQLSRTPNLGAAPKLVLVRAGEHDALAVLKDRGELAIVAGKYTDKIDPARVRELGQQRAALALSATLPR